MPLLRNVVKGRRKGDAVPFEVNKNHQSLKTIETELRSIAPDHTIYKKLLHCDYSEYIGGKNTDGKWKEAQRSVNRMESLSSIIDDDDSVTKINIILGAKLLGRFKRYSDSKGIK